jgi:hypothetical protein
MMMAAKVGEFHRLKIKTRETAFSKKIPQG